MQQLSSRSIYIFWSKS